jgi:hypothetical protein
VKELKDGDNLAALGMGSQKGNMMRDKRGDRRNSVHNNNAS